MKKRFRIAAVLLAAGEGKRFGSSIPKQHIKINNEQILSYVLRKFIYCGFFEEIVVVVHKKWIEKFPKIVNKSFKCSEVNKIKYVIGGSSRSQSSYNAIKFLENRNIDYVLFHDAVRPFIDKDLIEKVIKVALQSGVAITGIKGLESTAEVKNNRVIDVFPSGNIFFIQTPECFRFDLIRRAYKKFHNNKRFFLKATNLHLLFALKSEINIVKHNGRNLKLTFPPDLKIAQTLLNIKI